MGWIHLSFYPHQYEGIIFLQGVRRYKLNAADLTANEAIK